MSCKPWTTRIACVASTQAQVLGSRSQARRGSRVLVGRGVSSSSAIPRATRWRSINFAGVHAGHAWDSQRVMMPDLRQRVDPLKARCAATMRNPRHRPRKMCRGQRHLVHAVMKTGALIAITLWPKLHPTVSRRRQR